MSCFSLTWFGEKFLLHPDRGVYWPRCDVLLVADLHLGKDATFRAAGVPVPRGTAEFDLDRLGTLIEQTRASRLLVLGDFLHARSSRTRELFDALRCWRQRYQNLDCILLRGNHDCHSGDPPVELGFTCVGETYFLAPFHLCHDASSCAHTPAIAGHIHPSLRVKDRDGFSVTLPCFHFGEAVATLPAFGSFTGSHRIRRVKADHCCVVCDGAVLDVPEIPPRGSDCSRLRIHT